MVADQVHIVFQDQQGDRITVGVYATLELALKLGVIDWRKREGAWRASTQVGSWHPTKSPPGFHTIYCAPVHRGIDRVCELSIECWDVMRAE